MSNLNFTNLVAQGRAKAIGQPWSEIELEALLKIERERGIARTIAADFVRNGILTLEAYDRSVDEGFKPLSLEESAQKAQDDLAARGKEFADKPKKVVRTKKSK